MKREYMKPAMLVVKLQHRTCLLSNSVASLGTNLTDGDAISYGNGGSGDARVKDYSVWDEEW